MGERTRNYIAEQMTGKEIVDRYSNLDGLGFSTVDRKQLAAAIDAALIEAREAGRREQKQADLDILYNLRGKDESKPYLLRYDDVLDALEDTEAVSESPFPRWLHLDHDKPEDGQECIVWSEGVKVDTYHQPVDMFFALDSYGDMPVWWMPLPQRPEGEGKNK